MIFEIYKYQRKGCYERSEVHVANEEQVSTSVKSLVKQISCINKNET